MAAARTLGTPMGIMTVDAAPDFARRYVRASRPNAEVAPGARRPADMVPVRKADVDPKKATAWLASSAPTTAQKARTIALTIAAIGLRVGFKTHDGLGVVKCWRECGAESHVRLFDISRGSVGVLDFYLAILQTTIIFRGEMTVLSTQCSQRLRCKSYTVQGDYPTRIDNGVG